MVSFEPRNQSINADLARLKEARDFAERAAVDFGLEGESLYMIKLAMSEAVTNAIQHGSSAPSDPIHLAVLEEGGALVFEVRDTGQFVPRVPRRGDVPSEAAGSTSCASSWTTWTCGRSPTARCCASRRGGKGPDGGSYRRRWTTPVHPAGAVSDRRRGRSGFAAGAAVPSADPQVALHPELLVVAHAAIERVLAGGQAHRHGAEPPWKAGCRRDPARPCGCAGRGPARRRCGG